MSRRAAAWALVLCAFPAAAGALPVLRLALAGDAAQLGAGALDATESDEAAALRLERPALLTDLKSPLLTFHADDEEALQLGGAQFWSGTRADDFRSQATLAAPATVRGFPVAAGLSGRFETGELVLRDERDGELASIEEKRIAGQAALAAAPLPWLRIGGEVGAGLGHAWGLEALVRAGPFEAGLVRRSEELAFDVASPPGPRRKIQRPGLEVAILQQRQVGAFTLALRLPLARLSATADLFHPGDFTAQGRLKLWRMTFHARLESTSFAFANWATTSGTDVAHVDLGLKMSRLSVGTDLALGRHTLHVGHLETSLETSGTVADNGNVTGRKLFALDADFELFLSENYAGRLQSDGLGWSWAGDRLSFSAGLWHLRLTSDRGIVRYGSKIVAQLAGHDVLPTTVADAVGLSAGAGYRLGKLTLSLAVAQLVPYAASQPGSPPPKPGASSRPTPQPTGAVPPEASYDGGRLVLLELRRPF